MSMKDWAKKEVEIACKKENPDWDGKSFDYGCSCYGSALKAYNSLCDDGHSGYSFGITKNILIRLMDGHPLTPITEEDFKGVEPYSKDGWGVQCPRMSSLFKEYDKDGNIIYSDVDREYCIDINNSKNTYSSGTSRDIVNRLFPIRLPYIPTHEKYKVYTESFLVDKNNGDFDTEGYFYVITPDKKRIELNLFRTVIDGEWVNITKEEYEQKKKIKI